MTTREQYKSRWQQLESEIAAIAKATEEGYAVLPKVPHDSKEWKEAFDGWYTKISKPNKEKMDILKKEAETCRIRSLEKFYCNRYLYTDIQPYEVLKVVSDTRMWLRSMNAVQTNGSVERLRESFSPGGYIGHFDNSVQEWICTPDENGHLVKVRLHKDGRFYEAGGAIPFILSDKPIKYRDFNF